MSVLGHDIEVDEARRGIIAADLTRACEKIMAGIKDLESWIGVERMNDAESDNPPADNASIKETEAVIQGLKDAHTWIAVAAKEMSR